MCFLTMDRKRWKSLFLQSLFNSNKNKNKTEKQRTRRNKGARKKECQVPVNQRNSTAAVLSGLTQRLTEFFKFCIICQHSIINPFIS